LAGVAVSMVGRPGSGLHHRIEAVQVGIGEDGADVRISRSPFAIDGQRITIIDV